MWGLATDLATEPLYYINIGQKQMRNLLLTSAAIVAFATAASATELGYGFSLGADVATSYTVDAEDFTSVVTPTLSYGWNDLTLNASTDLSVWNNGWAGHQMFDVKPTIDLEAVYAVQDDLKLKAATTYDLEADGRGEITLTATLSF
tara:strand:- start:1400 stop:1840 length:441 start_codon:yes stop_codon:yes gene_type:complete